MRKLMCSCFLGGFFASWLAVSAADPPPHVRQICDPAAQPDICVPDTFEVIFGTDKTSTDSVYEYTAVPVDPIDVIIVTDTKSEKVQGWSYGVAHDVTFLTILEATVGGTDAEGVLLGGFDATSIDVERCDDAKCANRTQGGGFLSATVLSFKKPVYLTPGRRNSLCKAKYRIDRDVPMVGTFLEISNLLAAPNSPPTDINLTVDGWSKKWTNATDGWVRGFCCLPPCVEGIDSDGDMKVDCCDEDCMGVLPYCSAREEGVLCADGKDNDCDGKVDAADEGCPATGDCDTDPPPRVRQVCSLAVEPDVCVPDTFEVIFGTDKSSTDSVYQYTAVPVDPIDVTIVTDTKTARIQGWSYAVAHDMDYLTVLEATVGGTDAGPSLSGGFNLTTIDVVTCDSHPECAGRTEGGGFLSAVVLSFKKPVFLAVGQRNSICRAKYRVDKDAGLAGTYIEITNLITVPQAPSIELNITANGESKKWTNATDGWVKLCIPEGVETPDEFQRGDANDDGKVNIADPIWLINELVRQGPATKCQDAADANDDGKMDLSDAMYLIDWQFRHQAAPPAPGPFNCGDDVAADALSCDEGSTARCP